MNLRLETKEILWGTLFGIMFSVIIVFIGFLMIAGMSGCTSTTTKEEAKEIIKPFYDAGKEIYIEDNEKLKDETTNQETKQEEISKDDASIINKNKEFNEEISDAFPLSDLTFNVSVDTPQLANHMTGFQNQSHPWALMKDLPVTVTIKKFDASGIELEGVQQGQYTEKGWERTSTFWAFDENGVELGYEDHAYTSYEQPGKFYGKAKYILVVRCSDIQAIARSRVLKVK